MSEAIRHHPRQLMIHVEDMKINSIVLLLQPKTSPSMSMIGKSEQMLI